MANAFNLTAQLNLRGPANIKPVIRDIKAQLGNINANVNLTVAKNSSRNISKLNAGLRQLNATLVTTGKTSRDAAAAISSLGTAIGNINASKVSSSINQATQASAKLANQQKQVKSALQSSRTEMEEFGKQSGLAIRRFAAFSAVTAVVFKLNNAINTGVSSFINFQKEFIRLQQVTGESAQGLERLQKSITSLSTGLGVTSQELTQVSVTLAQAGLNARETEKALEALALSALAPSFDNLNNTVEGSIALMRQFGISSTELGSALGSINAVAAGFAVEAGDIIKAISRTGGVFANASKGVSEGTDALNEFIAVFTSVRSTTRESAETIATGLRTIFTRIQRGSTIEALKEFGVTLTDLEGKFVGPYKAIQLLSEGLGRLDPRDVKFSQIVEELGGFRQIGKVIPLIQQFSVAQRALGVAQAGAGSLAEDAAIAQLSLANQIAKTREEFLALFRDIGGSDSFQTIAKGALGVASALIKVADSIKGVLPILAIVTAAKGLSALTQFTAGFAGGIQRGGGARGFGARLSGAPSGFAKGGVVPGQGNRDTVPAMLTPGEFVIRKKAVETIGTQNLHKMNKYGYGGAVQKFAKGDRVRRVVEPSSQLQASHVGADVVLTKKQVQNYANTYKNKKFRNAVQQAGYSLEDVQSGNFNYETLRRNMNLTAKDHVVLNLPRSFNQALKANDPDLVSQQGLVEFIQGSSNLFKLTKAQQNKQKILAARSDMAKIISKLPSKRYDDSNSPQTPSFDHDYELNSLKSAFQRYFDTNAVDMMFNAPLSGAVYRKKDESGNRTGRLQIRRQDRVRAKYSKINQKLADGAAVKQGQQLPGVGIFDSDMIGAGSKDVLNALLSSGKPYDVISGPAGAGKTTFAKARFGNNFILSADDLDQYAQAVVLSSAGATKAGGFSPQAQALMARARKVIALQPTADRVLQQRQGRLDQAAKGSLPDKRSLKQLEGTFKAPTTIDRELYKGLSNVEFVQNFATGGLVEEDGVGAIVLTPRRGGKGRYGYTPSKATVGINKGLIENKLGQGLSIDPDAPGAQSSSFWSQIADGNKNYNVEMATTSKSTARSFRAIVKGQLLKSAKESASRLSQRIGLAAPEDLPLSASKDFVDSMNDASVGNLFENTLASLKGPPFSTDAKASFDFPNNQIRNNANLTSLFPGLTSSFVDAKSTGDEVTVEAMKTKILSKLAAEARSDRVAVSSQGTEGPGRSLTSPTIGEKYTNEEVMQMGFKAGSFGQAGFKRSKTKQGFRYTYLGDPQSRNLGGAIKRFAVGGSAEDTVPALLTPGEFVINKKAAKSIGSAKLQRLNKADKIQGYNKGGFVGFADGGGVPVRPDTISTATVAIPDSIRESLSGLISVLENLGVASSQTSSLINQGNRVSYDSAIAAAKSDIERAKVAGASAADIAAAEKQLLDIRQQADANVAKRQGLEKAFTQGATAKTLSTGSAGSQADILLSAEQRATDALDALTKARAKQKKEVTQQEIEDVRSKAFLREASKQTGTSVSDLKKQGITGADVQAYIAETQLDPRAAKQFNQQWLQSRTAILGGTKEAEKQAKQELKARRQITRQIQKARGLPTAQGFGGRAKDFVSNLSKNQASLGLSFALPMITDFFAGGEPTTAGGAATQAGVQGAASAVSSGLAVASVGGPLAGAAAAAIGLVKAVTDSQNAARAFTDQVSKREIERSVENLSKTFDKLSKDAKNVDLLRLARTDIEKITQESQSLLSSNTKGIEYGLINAFEMLGSPGGDQAGFERGRILQNQGIIPYLDSLFSSSERERLFSKEEQGLAQENAKIFSQASQATQQYIQTLIKSGKTSTDLLNDPAFLSIARNLALADVNVQKAVQALGGIDSAAGRQYLEQVTRQRAGEQINIAVRTEQLEELNTVAKQLSISFSRLFDTMNQQINASAYRLAEFNKNLEASIQSLSGRPEIGTDTSLSAINVLENPLAYSQQQFRGAADSGSRFFGADADMVSSLVQLGPNIEDEILGVINNVLATSGDNPEKASREINRAITAELRNLSLPQEITDKLARQISAAVGDIAQETDKGSISLQDLTEKISGLNNVIDASKKAREGVINSLRYWQDSLNKYSSAINKMTEIQLEAANRTRRANQIIFDSQVSLANALGEGIDLRFIERQIENTTRSRTGGPTDPIDISTQLRNLEDRRADQQAALSAVQSDVGAPGASANIIKMTTELSKTNYTIAETRAALEDLANNSDLASAALNEIQKAQQDQAGKVSFLEKLVTSTPEQLKNLNNSFADLQRYISGQSISIQQSTAAQNAYRKALRSGASVRDAQKEAQRAFADQRGNALSLLKEISPFLGDSEQANSLRADALETMLRESGVGINVMMRQVLDAMKNPELDPATAAAIETYKEATRVQALANQELARLNTDLAANIAKETGDAIKTALESTTIKFDQKQIDDMVDGIRNIGSGQNDPQNLASGGVVYASQGAAINFAPRGTDTVPAMLTPGEFVVNRTATQQHRPMLEAINNGYAKGGKVSYYSGGGFVAGLNDGNPSAELFSDFEYDTTNKVSPKVNFYDLAGSKDLKVQSGGFGLGWQIPNGSQIAMRDNKFTGEIVGGKNFDLNDSDRRYSTNVIPKAALSPVITNKTGNFALKMRDAPFISPSVSHVSNLANVPIADTIDLTVPTNLVSQKKQFKKAELNALVSNYDDVLNKMGEIDESGGSEYVYTKTDAGGNKQSIAIPKNLSKLADFISPPSISAEYTPGFSVDNGILNLKDWAQPFPGNIGFGFLDKDMNSGLNYRSLLAWQQPDNTGKSMFSTKESSGSNSIDVLAYQLDKLGNDMAGMTIANFISKRKEILAVRNNLKKISDQDSFGLSEESARQKKIVDKLRTIYNANSPYITADFTSNEIDFSHPKLKGKNLGATVYGGSVVDFERAFGANIDNLIGIGGAISADNFYGGKKAESLLEISKADIDAATGNPKYSEAHAFAWTQGVKPEQLADDFAEKAKKEKDKKSSINMKPVTEPGSFKLQALVNGNQKQLDIPYNLHYGEWDGKLWDSDQNKYSDDLLSSRWGSKAYVIGTASGTKVNAAFNPYAKYSAGDDTLLTAIKRNLLDSDALVKPDYIKKQFDQAAVKDYIGKAIEAGNADIPEKAAAEALMNTVVKGSNDGTSDINFFKKINGALGDYKAKDGTKGIPTSSRSMDFTDYLNNVVAKLIQDENTDLVKKRGEVANIDEFTDRYSRDLSLLIPAFETIGKTAYGLFGQGAPYNFGANFGVNVGNLQNLNQQQIKNLSGQLAGQLDTYYKNIERYVAEGSFNNINAYDLYNNAEILSYGAQQAFAALASGSTNAIARYLKPADLKKPNFNWRDLQPQALTMFRAIGGYRRATGFLNTQLTDDDVLDVQSIIGEGDVIRDVGSTGKITDTSNPKMKKIGDIFKIAFSPYNQFDEITDRKILINALKARLSNATGPNGRPLFSRQMTQNLLDSMEYLKIWFGGEPGANTTIAQPPTNFDAEGLPEGAPSGSSATNPGSGSSSGGIIPGLAAAGSFLPGLAGMISGAVGIAAGLAPAVRTGHWKGIDYLFDTDPPEPDRRTRINELQNAFDQSIYDNAKKGLAEIGGVFAVGTLPNLDYYKTLYRQSGGMIYASQGQLVNFEPKGTDTVPAMLTPGEFVVNRQATQKNLPLLKAINSGVGGYSQGGIVYLQDGGQPPRRPFDDGFEAPPAQNPKPNTSSRLAKIQQFNKLDKNLDGVLTPDEFSFLDRVWDTNFDGKISLDEYLGWFEQASSSDKRLYNSDVKRVLNEKRVGNIKESQQQTRDNNRANYEANRAFQRARSNALRDGASVQQANAAGQQAYRESMQSYSDSQTQKRKDIASGSTDYVFYRTQDQREEAINRSANIKAKRMARDEGKKAYEKAKAEGKSEDDAWNEYQKAYDDKIDIDKKTGRSRLADSDDIQKETRARLKEREDRKAKLDSMTPIDRRDFLRSEREERAAKKKAEAAEKKAREKALADEERLARVREKMAEEERRRAADEALGLEETLEKLYTNESDRNIYRNSVRKKLLEGQENDQTAQDVYMDIRRKQRLDQVRSRYTYHTVGDEGKMTTRLGKVVSVDPETGVAKYQQIDPVTGELTDNYTYEPINYIRENDPKAYRRVYDRWLSQENEAYEDRKTRKKIMFDYSGEVEGYEPRTWVGSDGKSFTGTVTRVGGTGATVTLPDGSTREIPRGELSAEDVQYVDSVRRYQTDVRIQQEDKQKQKNEAKANAQAQAFMERGVLTPPDLGAAAEQKLQEIQEREDFINQAAQDQAARNRPPVRPGMDGTPPDVGNSAVLTFDTTPTTPQRDAATVAMNNKIRDNTRKVERQKELNAAAPMLIQGPPTERPGTIAGGIPIEEAGKQFDFDPDQVIPFTAGAGENGRGYTWRELSNARLRSDLEKRLDENGRTALERFAKFYEALREVPVAGQALKVVEGVGDAAVGVFKTPFAITALGLGEAGKAAYQEYLSGTLTDMILQREGNITQKELEEQLLNDPVYQFFNQLSTTGARETQAGVARVVTGGSKIGEGLIDDTTRNVEGFLRARGFDANIQTNLYKSGLNKEVSDFYNQKQAEKYEEAAKLGDVIPGVSTSAVLTAADLAAEIGPDALLGPGIAKGLLDAVKTTGRTGAVAALRAAKTTVNAAGDAAGGVGTYVSRMLDNINNGPAQRAFQSYVDNLTSALPDNARTNELLNEALETLADRKIVESVTGELSDVDALSLAIERRQRLVARGLYDDATAAKLTGTEIIPSRNFADMDPKAITKYFDDEIKKIADPGFVSTDVKDAKKLAEFRKAFDKRGDAFETLRFEQFRNQRAASRSTTDTAVRTPSQRVGPTIKVGVEPTGPGAGVFDAGSTGPGTVIDAGGTVPPGVAGTIDTTNVPINQSMFDEFRPVRQTANRAYQDAANAATAEALTTTEAVTRGALTPPPAATTPIRRGTAGGGGVFGPRGRGPIVRNPRTAKDVAGNLAEIARQNAADAAARQAAYESAQSSMTTTDVTGRLARETSPGVFEFDPATGGINQPVVLSDGTTMSLRSSADLPPGAGRGRFPSEQPTVPRNVRAGETTEALKEQYKTGRAAEQRAAVNASGDRYTPGQGLTGQQQGLPTTQRPLLPTEPPKRIPANAETPSTNYSGEARARAAAAERAAIEQQLNPVASPVTSASQPLGDVYTPGQGLTSQASPLATSAASPTVSVTTGQLAESARTAAGTQARLAAGVNPQTGLLPGATSPAPPPVPAAPGAASTPTGFLSRNDILQLISEGKGYMDGGKFVPGKRPTGAAAATPEPRIDVPSSALEQSAELLAEKQLMETFGVGSPTSATPPIPAGQAGKGQWVRIAGDWVWKKATQFGNATVTGAGLTVGGGAVVGTGYGLFRYAFPLIEEGVNPASGEDISSSPAQGLTPEEEERLRNTGGLNNPPPQAQARAKGGIIYANNGALVSAQSRGTDTVPAMLTPGEFVINRVATEQNRPLLEAINSGQFNSGGLVNYLARGGYVTPQRLQNGGQAQQVVQQTQSVNSGVNNVSIEMPSWVEEFVNSLVSIGPSIMEASANIGLSAEQLANSVPSSVDINQNVNVQGSVGLDKQTLGRAIAMGSQQAGGYTDQKFNSMLSKLQNDTDGGVSFSA